MRPNLPFKIDVSRPPLWSDTWAFHHLATASWLGSTDDLSTTKLFLIQDRRIVRLVLAEWGQR